MIAEQRVTDEIHRWIDQGVCISDAVALHIVARERREAGPEAYRFDQVGQTGLIEDADGLLTEITDVLRTIPVAGNMARLEELSALIGWVQAWQRNHSSTDRINQKISETPKRGW